MSDRARLAQAIMRRDSQAFFERAFIELEPATPFVGNWHYEALSHQLNRVGRGEERRLILNVPPRSGKSVLASIAWPMFLLGHNPTLRVICISHTEDLAREFAVKRRVIAQSAWYQKLFPQVVLSAARDLELKTTQHGSIYAAGVGGAVLGRGADLIIIDDPIKGLDALSKAARRRANEFFDNTLVTRLNDKTRGAIVIIMQRLHEDDLVGHVRERDDWHVMAFPAIATESTVHPLSDDPTHIHHRTVGDILHAEREPLAVLDGVKRAQGSLVFQAQYQQAPTPAGGNLIKRDWLRYYDEPPVRFDRILASWDTASTLNEESDWSVGVVFGVCGLDYYVLEVKRARLEAPDLRREILELSARWKADLTIIEDTELGRAINQELARTSELRPILHRPRYDKEARLEAQSVRFEGGQVHLPRDAPWLGEYVAELLAFPAGRHDDQVDATSQGLDWLTGRAARAKPLVRREVVRREIVRR